MTKENILNTINTFEKETWKYIENEELYNAMDYIYLIEKEVKNNNEINLNEVYNKLLSTIGIIRFKYGFENIIINSNPDLKDLKIIINAISLKSPSIIDEYNYVSTLYNNYISKIKNANFIENKYKNGKEGLYLAVESLKSLINNKDYKQLLDPSKINELLVDCVKLNNDPNFENTINSKYKNIIKQIWKQSISNKIEENKDFKVLFSNISGNNLQDQAKLLINRPDQSSCSMISSNFMETYGDKTKKIGFIYPNNSEIILTSAYDLASNVFGKGAKNKEKGTTISTPQALEKIGIERKNKNDSYESECYNEILVNAKPCGILVLGLGENDLNIYYEETKKLSLRMNLPIYYIDKMQYNKTLSEKDKEYIAFHSLMSYLGITNPDINTNIYHLIDIYKEDLTNIFIKLKKEGKLNKHNMCQIINNIIDISKLNTKTK